MRVLRALLLGLLPCVLGPGCYRAEIDLGLLAAASPDSGGASGASGAPGVDCDMAPLEAEQDACRLDPPTKEECTEQDTDGWKGCYSGGCAVCTKSVTDYPYYFDWHPCCLANNTCNSNNPVLCNARCPPPTQHDKVPPCWLAEATP